VQVHFPPGVALMKMPIAAVALALGACLSLGACHSPRGGIMPSAGGSATYYSTEMRQASVVVIDVRTDEELFVMDIPVGKQLTMSFRSGAGDDPVMRPDLMRWELFDLGTRTGRLHHALTVPNAASRRVDVYFTQGPDYAEAPPEERLRIDEANGRPDWWTPQGGPMPNNSPAEMYDG